MKQAKQIKRVFHRFMKCESGHTAIEYGLIMALIFLAILGAVTHFSEVATAKMQLANEAITNAGT